MNFWILQNKMLQNNELIFLLGVIKLCIYNFDNNKQTICRQCEKYIA